MLLSTAQASPTAGCPYQFVFRKCSCVLGPSNTHKGREGIGVSACGDRFGLWPLGQNGCAFRWPSVGRDQSATHHRIVAHERSQDDGIGFTKLFQCRIKCFLRKLVIANHLSTKAYDYRFFFGQAIQASQVRDNIYGLWSDACFQRGPRVTRPYIIAVHFPRCGDYREFSIVVGKMRSVPQCVAERSRASSDFWNIHMHCLRRVDITPRLDDSVKGYQTVTAYLLSFSYRR